MSEKYHIVSYRIPLHGKVVNYKSTDNQKKKRNQTYGQHNRTVYSL